MIQISKKVLLLLILITYYQSLLSQPAQPIWSPIDSLSIADTINFSNFTKEELDLVARLSSDTLLDEEDSKFDFEDDFINERARLLIYHNNKLVWYEDRKLDTKFLHAFCRGYSLRDTIRIGTGIGFFAGLGFGILISKNRFTAIFEPNDDNDYEIYTWNKNDSIRMMRIGVPAITQKLSLSKFKNSKGELIVVGKLKADFREYYDINNNEEIPEKHKYSAEIVFQCRVEELEKRTN